MVVRDGLDRDDVAEVAALGRLAARRGPDDTGEWDDGRHCALAFRRLSIIDVGPGGHQPMASEGGDHVVVFNGELYNFRELRADLERAGCRFRSSSDTEVVLRSLAHWGTEALGRFNGMFSLAWYQPGPREVVLARDGVGVKPLAWWWSPEAFVFGSQYDQVVRHRRCRREAIDPDVLQLYLRLGFVPAPYGIVEGTGQVEPGHVVTVGAGGPLRSRPFRPPFGAAPRGERLGGREAADAVAAVVARSVERQKVSDVPVGAFLSGGVDSPLVAACLQEVTGTPVPAFTIGTDDPGTDESEPASVFADLLGVEHHVRRIRGVDAVGLLDDVAAANTEPFGDYSSFPTLLLAQLASEHVKVVLSGDGGDELFWGYPRFAKVRKALPWFRLPRAARVGAYAASKPLPTARRPARGVMFDTVGDWYLDAHSGLRDEDVAQLAGAARPLPATFATFDYDGPYRDDAVMQWMRANEMACHLPMVLQKVDRASMFHSLEVRVPLLDLELVDLAGRVEPDACLDGAIGKRVLRQALARHVPPERIPIPKRGFTVPMATWLRRDLRPTVDALLLDRDPFPHGFFDRGALRAWWADHDAGRRDRSRGGWNLLALQLWADRHLSPLTFDRASLDQT
jgi:asparagine synthase (glutamine-hydrolysing)